MTALISGLILTLLAAAPAPQKPSDKVEAAKVAKKVEKAKDSARQAHDERKALKDFEEEVQEYAEFHDKQLAKLREKSGEKAEKAEKAEKSEETATEPVAPEPVPVPAEGGDADQTVALQKALAARIVEKRSDEKAGDFFEKDVVPVFRRLIAEQLKGPDTQDARKAVSEGNPAVEDDDGDGDEPTNFVPQVNLAYPEGAPRSTVPASVLLTLPPLPEALQYHFVGRDLVLVDSVAQIIVDFLPGAAPDPGAPPPTSKPTAAQTAAKPPQPLGKGLATLTLPLKEGSVRFGIIGDTGRGTREQIEVGKQMAAFHEPFPFGFVIMLGDNIYGTDGAQDMKNKFETPYKPLLDAGVEFRASLGNHDNPNQRFYKLFNMGGERYYTFAPPQKDESGTGSVRFYAIDSNYLEKAQLDWLEKQLSEDKSQWKIAFFHHPLYSSGRTHGSSLESRAVLEPLFVKYGVSVVFAGHDHFYERTKPQKGGIVHFVSGSGGSLRKGNLARTDMTAKGFDTDYTFMLAEISGDDLYFQTISRTGATIDSGILHRPGAPAEVTPPKPPPVPVAAPAVAPAGRSTPEGEATPTPGPTPAPSPTPTPKP